MSIHRAALCVALACLPLIAGCSRGPGTPQGVVSALQSAAESKDYGAVWDLLSAPTRVRAEIALDRVAEGLTSDDESKRVFGTSIEGALGMNGRQRFIALLRAGQSEPRISADAALLKDVEIVGQPELDASGERATLHLRHSGQERDLTVVKEAGAWRIDGTNACGAMASRGDLSWLLLLPLILLAVRRRR